MFKTKRKTLINPHLGEQLKWKTLKVWKEDAEKKERYTDKVQQKND